MSVINTNMLSLVAQGNLSKSQGALGTAIERLSSGLRINSAKDDAAGQAIANRFTANIKGLTQAGRNANDGISIAQTTEGALNEINNNLQRVRELSVQAANGTNSDSDLKSIQDEIGQRLAEINRVSEQTQFNGVKVLASEQTLKIQVGAHDNEKIDINLSKINSTELGLGDFRVNGDRAATGTDLVSQFKPTGEFNYDVAGTAYKVDVETGAVTNATDTAVFFGKGELLTAETSLTGAWVDGLTGASAAAFALEPTATSFDYEGTTWTAAATMTADGNGAFTGEVDGQTVTMTVTGAATGTGGTAAVTGATVYANSSTATTTITTKAVAATEASLITKEGQKTGGSLTVNGTVYTVDSSDGVKNVAGDRMYISQSGTSQASLITQDDATLATDDALAAVDKALADVDSLRGELGAVQNRFQSTIANLSNTVSNLSAARSRIEDADYAVEVSNMTRAQILQQAGTSVLAQANQVPQTVLSLLR